MYVLHARTAGTNCAAFNAVLPQLMGCGQDVNKEQSRHVCMRKTTIYPLISLDRLVEREQHQQASLQSALHLSKPCWLHRACRLQS
jgi:hypothetical protein